MTRSVYLTSSEGESGKSTVALGLMEALGAEVGRVGVFRAVAADDGHDRVLELLLAHPAVHHDRAAATGTTYGALHRDREAALEQVVTRYEQLARQVDALVVLGSDFTDVVANAEVVTNARIAADLAVPVLLVVQGRGRTGEQVVTATRVAREQLGAEHATLLGIVVNRADAALREEIHQALDTLPELAGTPVLGVLPEVPLLVAPTVRQLMEACDGRLLRGSASWLDREAGGLVVAAMSMPNVLERLVEDVVVIAPGDRYDILPGLVLAHRSGTYPRLAAVVLTGGYRPPDSVMRLLDGTEADLPLIVTEQGTFETTSALDRTTSSLASGSPAKRETALRVFAESVDTSTLLAALEVARPTVTTPLMFRHRIMARARADRRTVVLPEGDEPRVLAAADSLLRQGVADLILLGEEETVARAAAAAGADVRGAQVVSPRDPVRLERYAQEYRRLRSHKGVTLDQARDLVGDLSRFATMMVVLGEADGMVSGAVHTTAHTIRPAFEVLRTHPQQVVSSAFLMCLAEQVLVYADCAVIPDPTAAELAQIAQASAATARQFDVEPRVAMLSYSTGSSGSGADVDKVVEATRLVRESCPELPVEGPIQYDAAVDPSVAATKLPGSAVAGRATVLVFPDLNTGNNTYKAVQRSSGAVAVGPVLQGLARPVNDLSRGATVEDIVITVAITAIQAQEGR